MRQVQDPQLKLGSVGIEEIRLDPKSREDIPAILLGLQIRRSNPPSTTWSTAASTGCAPVARTASPGGWPSPCWPSTSTASDCCCAAGR